MTKRSWTIGLTLLVVVSILASAGWWISARNAKQAVQQWSENGGSDGLAAAWSDFTVGGYPFRIEGRFADPTIDLIRGDQIIRWHAPSLDVSFSPLTPRRMRVDLTGHHELTVQDGDSEARMLVLQAATGWAEIERHQDEDLPREIVFEFAGVSALDSDTPQLLAATISGSFQRRTTSDDRSADAISNGDATAMATAIAKLRVEGLTLPGDLILPFSEPVDVIEIDLALAEGATDLLAGRVNAARLGAWRDAGGYLAVRRAHIGWGPLTANATGRLSVDAALQPHGQIDTRAAGLEDMIASMESRGLIDTNSAAVARLAIIGLGSFGQNQSDAADNGSTSDNGLLVPFTIGDRSIRLGPLKLADLPELEIPQD